MGRYQIDIDQLSYEQGNHVVLQDIHISIPLDAITLIAGQSGCGKTTLLRMLKKQLRPKMNMQGTVSWIEEDCILIDDMKEEDSACWIGYVSQHSEAQMVSDQVWHELAFGLENMGMDPQQIHQRIAETVSFLGLEELYHRQMHTLSGGQLQLINLASIIAMRPKVILLDEPTSQLDPIAKQRFYDLLIRIQSNYHIGIVMVEHSLESLLPVCDQVIYLEDGHVVYQGSANQLCTCKLHHNSLLPYPARFIQDMWKDQINNPITEKEVSKLMIEHPYQPRIQEEQHDHVFTCKDVYFRYTRDGKEVLRDFSLTLKHHEILCLFGGNGSGKTTFLKMLGSKHVKRFGHVEIKQKLLYLPQDPRCLFVKDSLKEEFDIDGNEEIIQQFHIESLLSMHPYDLSGGELQRAALALLCMQLKEECILLLDEPSKGLDMYYREELARILKTLKKTHTILIVTHDVEFAALCADRCGFLFDGSIASLKPSREFFLDNYFYTTYWRRCSKHLNDPVICYDEVIL